jgi:hypothetical protein
MTLRMAALGPFAASWWTTFASATTAGGSEIAGHFWLAGVLRLDLHADLLGQAQEDLAAG